MRWFAALLVACGGTAPKEPGWVADCDCSEGQICVVGGVSECIDPPAECGGAWDGDCDLSQIGDPCTAALCGFLLGDSGIVGSTSLNAECWTGDGEATERYFDCDAPLSPNLAQDFAHRIIVIGERVAADLHESPFGQIPGPDLDGPAPRRPAGRRGRILRRPHVFQASRASAPFLRPRICATFHGWRPTGRPESSRPRWSHR